MSASPGEDRRRFVECAVRSLHDDTFVRLVLSSPREEGGTAHRVKARLVRVRGESLLSVTAQEERRDLTENLPLSEVEAWLGRQLPARFAAALLETVRGDWQWRGGADAATPDRLIRHAARVRTLPDREHDREVRTAIDASASDWMTALGLLDPNGRPFPTKRHKHQQLLRFAEILGHLLDQAAFAADARVRAVDMGCGKGALTFAAWHVLRRVRGWQAEVLGIESREELAQSAQAMADGLRLDGLHFQTATVREASLPAVDILLALHACNTATDDAIARGIAAGARLIVVAPCCHQELRPQLTAPEPLSGIARHGLFAGRLADWLTDGLRALHLEWAGYEVKAIEFVDPEHTPKNLLLAAVRDPKREPFADPALRERIVALKTMFGVGRHALDSLLVP